MIPRRVEVAGFLCYKDAQAVELDGRDLWVFSGRNGSGKSSIFDAMTFALFGVHRGGSQRAQNLIHADASEFSVVFDFDLGPGRYRIRRGLRRNGRSERQAFRHELDDRGGEHWRPVPETGTDAGLRRWVQENVGLGYDVFTSSVLLLQGGAEKLVAADAAERHKILSGLVDLDRYRRLHALADDRRRGRRARVDALRDQLAASPRVEPEALEAAAAGLAAAEAARAAAQAGRDRLADLEQRARGWVELKARHEDALAGRERARRLIADSEAIGRGWRRLAELDAVLAPLGRAIGRRAAIAAAEAEAARCATERGLLAGRLDRASRRADEARTRLAEVVEEIGRDRARRAAILERQAALLAPIQRMRSARKQAEAVAALEAQLAADPDDPGDRVARLEEDHGRRLAWKAALPTLEALAEARDALRSAGPRIEAARRELAAAEAELGRLAAVRDARAAEEDRARRAEAAARDAGTAAATTLRAAEDRLAAFAGLEGAPSCDRCGQALTPGHVEHEVGRLRDERDAARARSEEARRALRSAEARASAAEAGRAEADRALQAARDRLARTRRDLDELRRDAARHEAACARAHVRLDPPFRRAVAPGPPADWLATTYPAPADLDEGRRAVAGLDDASRRLGEARATLHAWRDARTRLDQARLALGAIGLRPGDDGADAEHARLAEEVAALDRCLLGHERDRDRGEAAVARLARLADAYRLRDGEWERRLISERSRIEAWHAESDHDRAALPEAWRGALDAAGPDELAAWEAERAALEAAGVRDLAAELPRAQLTLRRAEADVSDLERRLAAVPEEARRDPRLIAALRDEAGERLEEAEAERRDRQVDLDRLRRDEAARRDLEARLRQAEAELIVIETLARLLGREGLQRELLRDAERGILEAANPILREVSGGELQLRLVEGDEVDAEPALSLEALVRTHGRTRALGVPYLSGSQKFRVAVSLALGIGQFARGGDRPIQAVIIDEGFGCLDRRGRDEMIAELNALKGRLARIILVSHQEEFADAFADGYRFEVVDGATRVEPFHR